MKTECSSGAGKMQCLYVHKGESLDHPKWETFYAPIEGFQFEEGYLKKLKIKSEKIENPPADGSSIKYVMVKELEKKIDFRVMLSGNWILNKINDIPIDRSIELPELEININQMKIVGTGGCNNYSGDIASLTNNTISFRTISMTEKACINKNIETDYFKALNKVTNFKIKDKILMFYDENENLLLTFIEKNAGDVNLRIQDVWIATKFDRNPINRMLIIPTMEINLADMKVFGNDGCNEYSGTIKKLTENQLEFGILASTRKMCRNMDAPESFHKAMAKVKSYKLNDTNLILMDENGEEVLTFLKKDK